MSQSLDVAFKSLGHPKRLAILKRLIRRVHTCCMVNREEECCMEEPTCDFGALKEDLGISKSSLSLHLKELRHAGLVEKIKNGRKVALQVNPDRLEELKEFFEVSIDQKTRDWMQTSR
ncbi:helix-turn-helix domain-containing protein [Aliifodinibius sp. S!AR15-10]|uniref:ArsR/SmtB family transcription factor n=1 Tax=Aliifodinibius sp. S!AR15-10 TaxID=2950437 RepID=UPI00285A9EE3|nr:metalloregulator ArsR/SmtB family transcription factor [Aliifodinibius sp. S!AR15-10]MDR8389837.1 helix-turn-helix domain-containing protein [Aliifodinibius sp. S!AR15-10]